jgi:cardiolipin synthase A/B
MNGPNVALYALAVGAHVAVAIAVTGHVLFNKRDVRAALGWIGIAWLSPVLGPGLYYVFGINRVSRKMSRVSRAGASAVSAQRTAANADCGNLPDNIATIATVGTRATGRPLLSGNRLEVFQAGDEAYPAMLEAIAASRLSIALSSYIFRPDRIGSVFVETLAAAQKRGVEIRVLVDGIGSGYFFSRIIRILRAAGIPSAQLMHDWLPWRMSFINLRNHRKLLVVDGAVGFTGGLNLGDENVRRFRRPRPVDDVHFRVEGPVVGQLMLSFAEDWRFATGESLDSDIWWTDIARSNGCLARTVTSGPDEDIGKIEAIWAAAVGQAKSRLRIVTPYFLPDGHLMSAIVLAALRGVQVDLVIPRHTDHTTLDWAMRAHLGFYAVPGLDCYMTPPPFDHAKLVTVDGGWCSVGSANWDVRSLRLNFELMLECYDPPSVEMIDRLIDDRIARAQSLNLPSLRRRPWPVRFRDATARLLLPYL